MDIAVVGTGYVGLVSGACLADWGHNVTCIDTDASRIAALRRGSVPFYEPGLARLLKTNGPKGRLRFSTDLKGPVGAAEAVFVAVGTPPRPGDGHADLSCLYAAVKQIGSALRGRTAVIIKSTVPVGTGDEAERIIRKTASDETFAVVSNPEFLREGSAVKDFKRPDRVVIGTAEERACEVLSEIYRPLCRGGVPFVCTGRRTAELIKYASNALLATKIAFINEVADLCERVQADVTEVALGMGLDHRIGTQFLQAGPGFGGSCFPKDAMALVRTAQDHGSKMKIVESVVASNESRKRNMAKKIAASLGRSAEGARIAILGLAFKANTDDMREAPCIPCIRELQAMGAEICAYDPAGMKQARVMLPDVEYAADPYACAADAHALVIMTEWDQFRHLDLSRIRSAMLRPIIVDLRNLLDPAAMTRLGFDYRGVGRPADRKVVAASDPRAARLAPVADHGTSSRRLTA
jgi:UDPglucose 6-dehydrogenase